MNAKFILFCIASLGSLMMFYMWYSINSSTKESQTMEEQYNYRISALKSEIEIEKKLMESLRKDTRSFSQSINEKTSLIDKMNKKGLQIDKEKVKLEKEMNTLKMDLDKLTKSNDDQKKKMERETDEKQKEENTQIDSLENDIKKLQIEKNDLMTKHSKVTIITKIDKSGIPIDNTMQGKAPKRKEPSNKIHLDKKDDQKPVIPLIPSNRNFKDGQKSSNQLIKDSKIDVQPGSKADANKPPEESRDSRKTKSDEENMEHKAPNSKPETSNENIDSRHEKPIIGLPNVQSPIKKENSQLISPENQAKDIIDLNQKDKPDGQGKLRREDVHQLKPPKSNKESKDDVLQMGIDIKSQMNKDIKIEEKN